MNNRIAFFLPTLNIGGIERVFLCYANKLAERGYTVDFVLCKREGLLLGDVASGVNMFFLDVVKLRWARKKLRRYLKEVKPNVVVSGGDYPNMLLIVSAIGLQNKPNIVISQHNYNNIEGRSLGYWARYTQLLMRLIYPMANQVIAISEGIKAYLCNDIHVKCDKVIKINNPIDIDNIYIRSKEKIKLFLPEDFIVFIGRISLVKNIPLLLEAYEKANIGNVGLVIVGDGPELFHIKQIISGLNKRDNIYCVGSLNNPLPILAKAKALVLSSLSEAFPTVLLEAMCLNKPIISTPTNGALEILNGVEGAFISTSFENINEFSSLIEKGVIKGKIDTFDKVRDYSEEYIIDTFEKKIIFCTKIKGKYPQMTSCAKV